ncbi:hypothetical protein L6452_35631 [Arctium lappa]|uniref:Uncharacterized protein n=1 Tax=Arctium lappa TaxID=4217 RepID=A0ACB8Y729_ARCLA|nr:hypothetical protein L6452_35631 [Arctium lappa]
MVTLYLLGKLLCSLSHFPSSRSHPPPPQPTHHHHHHHEPPLNNAMEPPDLPECPVCLQPFDNESTIPRVLACGHSSCESCLHNLPKPPFPRTIRCPACTQLVPYPHPQGPSALPKNIDLLRITSSLTQSNPKTLNPIPKTPITSPPNFIPNPWSHQFHNHWKNWVFPHDAISIDGSNLQARVINLKNLKNPSFRCVFKGNHEVGLFKVGFFMRNDVGKLFEYGYVAKAMWVLFEMKDVVLGEIELILMSSLKGYRICMVYGLWFNEEDDCLYLVCERKDVSLSNVVVSDLQYDNISSFGLIGMELCEAMSGLREVGLVFGCASLSCYCVDEFRHVFVDLNEVLMVYPRVRKMIMDCVSFGPDDDGRRLAMDLTNDGLKIHVFPSPELLVEFVRKEGVDLEFAKSTFSVGYSSDVWSLGCMLVLFLAGKSFVEETNNFLFGYILALINGNGDDGDGLYVAWLDKVSGLLDARLGSKYVFMKKLLHKCLCLDPESRPLLTDVWKCLREVFIKPKFDVMGSSQPKLTNESVCHCLLLGDLLWSLNKTNEVDDENGVMNRFKGENLVVESDVVEGFCKDSLICTDLKGHLDCISGLAIGGGFLFSCSFDKTVNVWSLQGFNHVHTFKGHEHKVMAVVFVNREPPLCISADNGGDIFIWGVKVPFEENAIKRLNEGKDWRYSGIHALAVSESGFFYTGSGDKSIKAWSMHDYSLSCTMIGHKAVVSTLAVSNQVLYSGSWDGTIRLWCLNDHTPLAVLGEEAPGTLACGSVLSLAADGQTLVAAHENGRIKIWNNDVPLNPVSTHTNSVFSIYMDGQWLFSGGWDKTVVLQKLSSDESGVDVTQIGTIPGDSVVTTLLYWQGKLFVGHADRTIKVYSFEG